MASPPTPTSAFVAAVRDTLSQCEGGCMTLGKLGSVPRVLACKRNLPGSLTNALRAHPTLFRVESDGVMPAMVSLVVPRHHVPSMGLLFSMKMARDMILDGDKVAEEATVEGQKVAEEGQEVSLLKRTEDQTAKVKQLVLDARRALRSAMKVAGVEKVSGFTNSLAMMDQACSVSEELKRSVARLGKKPRYESGESSRPRGPMEPEEDSADCMEGISDPYQALTHSMESLHAEVQSLFNKQEREDLRYAVESIMQGRIERGFGIPTAFIRVELFGSSTNGLGSKEADVDMCLVVDQGQVTLTALARYLRQAGFRMISTIPSARVPIVKFRDRRSGLHCDLCVNNVLALHNTNLLWHYTQIDSRFPILTCTLKKWAKANGIHDASKGMMSSYALTCVVIHYLQIQSPPILPYLQLLVSDSDGYPVQVKDGSPKLPIREVQGKNVYFYNPLDHLRDFGTPNWTHVSSLLKGFIEFALTFRWSSNIISIRTPTPPRCSDTHKMYVEDPFDGHNLTAGVGRGGITTILNCFAQARDQIDRVGTLLF